MTGSSSIGPKGAPASSAAILSPLAAALQRIGDAPPFDAGRVAALRSAIAAGSYTPDPAAIADALLTGGVR